MYFLYLSFVCNDQERNDPNEITLFKLSKSEYDKLSTEERNKVIAENYFSHIFIGLPSHCTSFLSYQFDNCQREHIDFFYFVEWTISEMKRDDFKYKNLLDIAGGQLREKLINEWIIEKKKELQNIATNEIENTIKGKRKRPTIQEQLILLEILDINEQINKLTGGKNSKKAALLSLLFDKTPQNIREGLIKYGRTTKEYDKKKVEYLRDKLKEKGIIISS